MLINKDTQQASILTILLTCTEIAMVIALVNMALASYSSSLQAGGGNSTLPYTIFNPQSVQIKTGQSIMWYNPSVAPEPHTVTFALDNNTIPELSASFAVKIHLVSCQCLLTKLLVNL